MNNQTGFRTVLLLLCVLIIGGFLRFPFITMLPLGYDEAIWGNVARNLIDLGTYTRSIWTYPVFKDHPPVHIYQISLSFMMTGVSVMSLRLPSVLGSLVLVIIFFLIYVQLDLPKGSLGAFLVGLGVASTPYGINMALHAHVEISVLLYGSLALLITLRTGTETHWYTLLLVGGLIAFSVFSKFIGVFFLVPVLLVLCVGWRKSGKVSVNPIHFFTSGMFLLVLTGILLGTVVINLDLASRIPTGLWTYYQGIAAKFLDVILPIEVDQAPWRTMSLGKFINRLHRYFFPGFALGIVAGIISLGQLIFFRLSGKSNVGLVRVLITEQYLFLGIMTCLVVLCCMSGATRSMDYAFTFIPFLYVVLISVFTRLVMDWSNTSMHRGWTTSSRVITLLALSSYFIMIGFGLVVGKPWEIISKKMQFPLIAASLREITGPNDYVIIDPYGPEISFLAERPYDILYPCDSIEEIIRRLTDARAVVLEQRDLPNLTTAEMGAFKQYLNDHFDLVRAIDDYSVYLQKKKRSRKARIMRDLNASKVTDSLKGNPSQFFGK
ncbi:glycosyltransferase family 39 protein [bacterium]|nr:glycosyltransferase family 39 protein [bacterium]